MLFPEVIMNFSNGWRVPAKRRGRDTGKFQDPKRIFKEEISRAGTRYRESDAPAIASRVVGLGGQATPSGRNRSYETFGADANGCCQKLIDSTIQA